MRYSLKVIDKTDWHRWFAWFPVKARNEKLNCDELVWLEYVLRKKEYGMHPNGMHHLGAGDYMFYKYRTIA